MSFVGDSFFERWDFRYSSYWLDENRLLFIVAVLHWDRSVASYIWKEFGDPLLSIDDGFGTKSNEWEGLDEKLLFDFWLDRGLDLERDLKRLNFKFPCLIGLIGGCEIGLEGCIGSFKGGKPTSIFDFTFDWYGGGQEKVSVESLLSRFLKAINMILRNQWSISRYLGEDNIVSI